MDNFEKWEHELPPWKALLVSITFINFPKLYQGQIIRAPN